MNSLNQEINELKNRLESLENIIRKSNTSLNMFGRSYSNIGSIDSDFLIKTKGQVKILWGLKFIDLIKDGKISVDSKFIYKLSAIGVKDGIYVIGEGESQQIFLKVNDLLINLKGLIGTTYVSFLDILETSPEQKYIAMSNIGFLYKNILDVSSSGLKNGIVYVEETNLLYIIQNGALLEFKVELPNPYPSLFIIQKLGGDLGALVIKGEGSLNSLSFNTFNIYTYLGNMQVNSSGEILLKILDVSKMVISNNLTTFTNNVVSSMFLSPSANETSGFRLFTRNKESTLEVDNVIIRNLKEDSVSQVLSYPNKWYNTNNVIQDVKETSDLSILISLLYENLFLVGQNLYTYSNIKTNYNYYRQTFVPLKITLINSDGTIISELILDLIDSNNIDYLDLEKLVKGLKWLIILLISLKDPTVFLRRLKNTIDIVETVLQEQNPGFEKVLCRIGNIDSLQKQTIIDGVETPVSGIGIYSDSAVFLLAEYTKETTLLKDDNSYKFASTTWVNNKIRDLLPIGSIIMFNGESKNIPDGWEICNGLNGTPNLVNKFIKASETSGNLGGNNQLLLEINNIPEHTHTVLPSTVTTSASGRHIHEILYLEQHVSPGDYVVNTLVGDNVINTDEAELHTHTIEVSNIALNNTGGNSPILIEPEYYSLIFIMRTK